MPQLGPYCKRHCKGFQDTGGKCFLDDCAQSVAYYEGVKDTIEGAIEWLESIRLDYYVQHPEELVKDFRKAMEE